jgi:L-lactate utilization protein LutC
MSRDHILHKVRTAIGRSSGDPPEAPPAPLLRTPEAGLERRLELFAAALGKLGGQVSLAASCEEARRLTAGLIEGRSAVASNAKFLRQCGLASLPGVFTGFRDAGELREAAASCDAGITSADYALADTGSLVLFSSPEEPRLISLLPPLHIAVVPKERLLTGVDELFQLHPDPAGATSAMVIITGPSRTADIEQILVRGVHGPGSVHVIFV